MTTEKLIERARCCPQLNETEDPNWENCCNCPHMFVECKNSLVKELTKKLEKAYADLKKCSCETCEYNDICEQGGDDIPICTNGNMWKWEGDSE